MKTALHAVVSIVVLVATFAGPAVHADQGKSGDGEDWGCGGHLATAASLTASDAHPHVKATRTIAQDSWRTWWYLNRPTILDVSYRVAGPAAAPPAQEKWRDDARAALRGALDSPPVALASAAALSLGRAGDPRDTEILLKIAGDLRREQNTRRRAALALGLLPVEPTTAKAARETLFSVLRESVGNRDDRVELWSCAACALGLRADEAEVPRLADFLDRHRDWNDGDHELGVHREVMGSATGALGLFGTPLVLPNLTAALKDGSAGGNLRERKDMISRFAAYGLARLGDKAALPALRAAATDERLNVSRAALLALGALAEPDDADTTACLLVAVAAEKDDPARSMAALSLGRSGAEPASAGLLAAYRAGSPTVRSFAALGLALFTRRKPDREVNNFLLAELLLKHDAQETGALCIANGLAGNLASAKRLAEIARDEGDAVMRADAAFALGLLGAEGAPPQVLLDLVVHGSPLIRHEAALALGLARRKDGVDALLEVLVRGKDHVERGSAAVALGRIAGPEAAPPLMKILRDEHEVNALRICAAHGLGLLLDRSEGRRLGLLAADVNWINDNNRTYTATEVIDQLLLIMD